MKVKDMLVMISYAKEGTPIIRHTCCQTMGYSENCTTHLFEEVDFLALDLHELVHTSYNSGYHVTNVEYGIPDDMLPLAKKYNCKVKWIGVKNNAISRCTTLHT